MSWDNTDMYGSTLAKSLVEAVKEAHKTLKRIEKKLDNIESLIRSK